MNNPVTTESSSSANCRLLPTPAAHDRAQGAAHHDAQYHSEPSGDFITFILGQLNVARLEALCAANEIATTAAALSGGLISVEAAILHLDQLGFEVSS